ncbi:MAG: right-handed parallel beta-helix repeat-containing protein, partial [Parvularculaceae bacterium]|nr:right-handed parallel beta-helix repeat-containing protein [Parvularculaceae bacterium]
MRIELLAALALVFAAPLPANAAPGDPKALVVAINKAKIGGVVLVPAGEYDIADMPIRRSVALKGDGDVVFYSSRSVRKGILVPTPDVSLRVENITFRGARSPDLNGAGIRHDGLDLEIVDCVFDDNENGVLATGSDFGRIRVTGSTFRNNGHGDGYSHGIYVSSAESLVVENSTFVGTRIGHHVKSLAASTRVAGSNFDDVDGRTSYALDVSAGGAVTFENNTVVKSAEADNETYINYDLTRGGKAKSLRIVGNRFVSRNPRARLLRNETKLKPVVEGNSFVSEKGGRVLDAPADSGPAAAPVARPQIRGEAAPRFIVEPPFPAPLAGGGVLAAPTLATPQGALAALRFENPFDRASVAGILTFGQAFPEGALKSGDPLALDIGGVRTFVQVDVKARHADGSVRHAALSVRIPALKARGRIDAALFRAAAAAPAAPDFAALVAGLSLPAATTLREATGQRAVSVDAGALAAKALVANKDRWLEGALVRETRFETPIAPHLLLRVDARVSADGALRLSLAYSNEKTFSAGPRDLRYDVRIGAADAPVFAASGVDQHRASVWRRVVVAGPFPRLHIVRDLAPFVAAAALPPLDRSQG